MSKTPKYYVQSIKYFAALLPLLMAFFILSACTSPVKKIASETASENKIQPATQVPEAQLPKAQAGQATVEGLEVHYYGIYLNGNKTGWMRNSYQKTDEHHFEMELHAKVSGMGTVADVFFSEKRNYSLKSGLLSRLEFSQEATTGSVHVLGLAKDEAIEFSIETAGRITKKNLPGIEKYEDAIAREKLAQTGKVADGITTLQVDASLLQKVEASHKIKAIETRLIDGVESEIVIIITHYPTLNIKEESVFDRSGKILEMKVGGFFVARLEDENTAKRLDYQRDLLLSSVVKPPNKIANPKDIESMTIEMTGFGETLPPETQRQKVTQKDLRVILNLSKEKTPPSRPIGQVSDADSEWLESTPFIQSDAEAIITAAKKVTEGSPDSFAALSALTHYVYKHVKDEYVPSYSNALEALNTGRGDCTEHSVLFVALARALKIPARVAVGIAYWPPGDGFGWHAWAEAKIGDRWITIDPTWNQPIADATHIKLAGGGPAEQARIVMLLGALKIESVR